MKLLVSALLLAAAAAAIAQSQTMPSSGSAGVVALDLQAAPLSAFNDQAGCPLVFEAADLTSLNRAGVFPVSANGVPSAGLRLRFENASGKPIRSVGIDVRVTGKADKYQLDASTFTFQLTFSGTNAVDRAAEQLRQIPLPRPMYPYGMSQVSLSQVFFTDGSTWTAPAQSNCSFSGPQGAERIQAK